MMKIDTRALQQLTKAFKSTESKARSKMRLLVKQLGSEIVSDVKTKMTEKNKTGRIYRVGTGVNGRVLKNVRLHRASAGNEHPAVRSGNLRKSMYYKVRSYNTVVIGNSAKYAKYLEHGTSKMQPRKLIKRPVYAKIQSFKTTARLQMYRLVQTSLSKKQY